MTLKNIPAWPDYQRENDYAIYKKKGTEFEDIWFISVRFSNKRLERLLTTEYNMKIQENLYRKINYFLVTKEWGEKNVS